MQNCRKKAPDKIVSTERWMDRQKDRGALKLHMHNFISTQTLCVNFRGVLAKM